jgi:DNA-binding transcriptional ArsR family regulator
MTKKNFILMSMEDAKIKKISNVISNDSCRKILDFLAEKESTESELAQTLGIPISTVHYNLQQLVETGLIESTEFHYSKKGKEVSHYRLANKYIIIAPKKTYGLKERLKGLLPVGLISLGAAGIIQLLSKVSLNSGSAGLSAGIAAPESFMARSAAQDAALESAPMMAKIMAEPAPVAQSSEPSMALWFLLGAIFAMLLFFIIALMRKEK